MTNRNYTTTQAAEILGTYLCKTRRMVDEGKLRGFRIGRGVRRGIRRIPESSIINLMKQEGALENQEYLDDRKAIWKQYGFNPFSRQQDPASA